MSSIFIEQSSYIAKEMETLRNELIAQTDKQDEINFIRNIGLCFEKQVSLAYLAYAVNEGELPEFYSTKNPPFWTEESKDYVVYNLSANRWAMPTLIHEVMHLAIAKRETVYTKKHNGYHCLEFALMVYATQWRIMKQNNKHNKSFFRSYDIHEDIAYPNLFINPCKFDSLVKTIQWESLDDLYNKCDILADQIRKKYVQY